MLVHNANKGLYGVDFLLGIGEKLNGFRRFVGGLKSVKRARRLVTDYRDTPFYNDKLGMWGNIVNAMKKSDKIHFNLRGVSPKNYKNFVNGWRGANNAKKFIPDMKDKKNITNRELLEILTNPDLLKKTVFHGGRIGDFF